MAKWVLPDDVSLAKVSEAMKLYKMSLDEVIQAMQIYANDRDYQRALDEHYNNMLDPSQEYWTP